VARAGSSNGQAIPCTLHYRKLRTSASLPAISEAFAGCPSAAILGGNPSLSGANAFSYWAAGSREIFEFTGGSAGPFGGLEAALAKYGLSQKPADLPDGLFCGGWIGYFGYDLGRYIERLPRTVTDDLQMPLIRLAFYDRLIAYDHGRETFWLVALQLPNDAETSEAKLAALEQTVHDCETVRFPEPDPINIEGVDASTIRTTMGRSDYLRAIERIKRYIRDGDVYQVNLSQRFESPFSGRPIDLFHWQNRFNPSPYAAYLDAGRFHVVSASPEMFVTVRDGTIRTRPIKGTRPRLADGAPESEATNARNHNELLTSEKERAELNMIVDLERNDLARICKPGTRYVEQPRTIEAYPTVFHAVATVAGQLRDEATFSDILRASFPGGSITGAPKIRAMEIIDEMEPTARGLYTGSIGAIGLDGSACLNIAIRTVIIAAGRAYVQTGGGIVADSVPQAEWEETITKARALLAGIEATQGPA
jgi:para-aminobenzoate synthetase component 1